MNRRNFHTLPTLALFSSRAQAPKKIVKPLMRLAVPLAANYPPYPDQEL
jgi:hypothetical protein